MKKLLMILPVLLFGFVACQEAGTLSWEDLGTPDTASPDVTPEPASPVEEPEDSPPIPPPADDDNDNNGRPDVAPLPSVGPDRMGPAVAPNNCFGTRNDKAFADRVVSYRIGEGGGFQKELLPDVVLGGPLGEGLFQGGYDIFSLGVGGEIILEFSDVGMCDGPGADFIVFENAFRVGNFGAFVEPAIVSVSDDGRNFRDFPCSLTSPYVGCAGLQPVLANVEFNDINPLDPNTAGGDAFDLATIGLKKARFLRIRDSGLGLGPSGFDTDGFDLDAVAVVNGF